MAETSNPDALAPEIPPRAQAVLREMANPVTLSSEIPPAAAQAMENEAGLKQPPQIPPASPSTADHPSGQDSLAERSRRQPTNPLFPTDDGHGRNARSPRAAAHRAPGRPRNSIASAKSATL